MKNKITTKAKAAYAQAAQWISDVLSPAPVLVPVKVRANRTYSTRRGRDGR